jgi:hypothetical protein
LAASFGVSFSVFQASALQLVPTTKRAFSVDFVRKYEMFRADSVALYESSSDHCLGMEAFRVVHFVVQDHHLRLPSTASASLYAVDRLRGVLVTLLAAVHSEQQQQQIATGGGGGISTNAGEEKEEKGSHPLHAAHLALIEVFGDYYSAAHFTSRKSQNVSTPIRWLLFACFCGYLINSVEFCFANLYLYNVFY